jgi:hypothetical protein
VPVERIADLPGNPLGARIAAKQPEIFEIPVAADQVSVIALGVSEFTRGVVRVSPSGSNTEDQPTLVPDPNGEGWLVTASNGESATERFWELLLDRTATY